MKILLVIGGLVAISSGANAQTFFGPGLPAGTFYGGALFDVKNVSAEDLTLTGNIHAVSSWTGDGTYRVYTKVGSYVGSESTLSDWTPWAEVSANGAGPSAYMNLALGSCKLVHSGDTLGMAIFHVGGSGIAVGDGAVGYRNGSNTFSDGNLSVTTGVVKGYGTYADPFNIHTVSSRTWAGEIQYASVPEPASMFALGLGACALLRRRRR